MAVIVSVHGTGATGPEEGSRWWQRGSPFERFLKEHVAPDGSDLSFTRVIWSGANSEAARREAAARLLALMHELERNNQHYALIGHSHGGSVIASALLAAAAAKKSLPKLSTWITVGTPFLSFTRSRLAFAKLNTRGRALYLSLLIAVAWFSAALSAVMLSLIGSFSRENLTAVISITALVCSICSIPMVMFVFGTRLMQRRKFGSFLPRTLRRANEWFSDRHFGLFHKNDEAIQGLMTVRAARVQLFGPEFATNALVGFMLLGTLVGVLLLPFSDRATGAIISISQPQLATPTGQGYLFNIQYWLSAGVTLLLQPLMAVLDQFMSEDADGSVRYSVIALMIVATAMAVVAVGLVIFALSYFYLVTVKTLARAISRLLSRILNAVAWREVNRSLYGSDVLGESDGSAREYPVWFSGACGDLPKPLSDEISKHSDAEAARSLARFRAAFSPTNIQRAGGALAWAADYLTWEELIHTSYFNIPGVRKLIAFQIGVSPGFKESEALSNDRDHSTIIKWHDEIRRSEDASTADESAVESNKSADVALQPP